MIVTDNTPLMSVERICLVSGLTLTIEPEQRLLHDFDANCLILTGSKKPIDKIICVKSIAYLDYRKNKLNHLDSSVKEYATCPYCDEDIKLEAKRTQSFAEHVYEKHYLPAQDVKEQE